jgi:signal transduction histidine kinase
MSTGLQLTNLDLLSVGIAIASIGILGFAAFFSNRKSVTNQTFLYFSIAAIIWSVINYLNYQVNDPTLILWLLRGVLFFAVWYTFFLYRLSYVFPNEQVIFSRNYKIILICSILIALFCLTPFVFSGIAQLSSPGQVSKTTVQPGIAAFILLILFLVSAAFYTLIKKLKVASGTTKRQLVFILIGAAITFTLHVIFNLILPAVFLYVRFIPLGAVFILPLVALTAYAIFRHGLFSVKVVATEILTFVLAIITLFEVVLSQSLVTLIFQIGVFILVLVFGVLLIQSVLREVEQREELERLNKQIEDQNKQLEELSHFKTELLSLASHQMKSPLAAIKGFGSLLLGGQMGTTDDKAKETVGKMVKSADGLVALINTLLDLRKVEEGKMDYQFARVDLAKLVADMFEMLKPLAAAKQLEFTLAAPPHPVWVNADAEKLKQVIQNLTDNAIKYTPKGFVKVELTEALVGEAAAGSAGGSPGSATVAVTDSGVGFSPDLAPHLFEEFVRDERVKKQILGTGLGLYIARRIAEAHGGKIAASSPGPDKGATFSVTVPEVK